MSESIDMVAFVKELSTRTRGKACLVLTRDFKGQKEWATELARQTNSDHVDLLELFKKDQELSSGLTKFTVPALFEFLQGQSQKPVLIVSGLEFLKATWCAQPDSIENFLHHVSTRTKNPCLLFVLQYDPAIANYKFEKRYQYRFVIQQEDTFKL